jgi:hypothetical protein
MEETYASAANKLKNYILSLIEKKPEILDITDPFALFSIDGFVNPIDCSVAQTNWALNMAKQEFLSKGA